MNNKSINEYVFFIRFEKFLAQDLRIENHIFVTSNYKI